MPWRALKKCWSYIMNEQIDKIKQYTDKIIGEVERAVIGKRLVLEKIAAAILCPGGHILLEDYPGLAKTLIASSFARAMGLSFKRIQFTPDLLPQDITGGYIFNRAENTFVLKKGPVFANIVLADEINRATPKTQSALLEAMQEYQVTIDGETIKLPQPFIVIATQNPIEYDGTFPLPEAQLDRFLIKLSVGYPSAEEEFEILQRRQERKKDIVDIKPVTDNKELLEAREIIEEIFIHDDIQRYIIDIIRQTRNNPGIAVGAGPRGTLAVFKIIKTWAAMRGKSFALPDYVKEFAGACLSHRLVLQPELWAVKNKQEQLIHDITKKIEVPVI